MIHIFESIYMKAFFTLLLFLTGTAAEALANPACIVCTVAIGASLEISRKLGISDDIVGLWTGALFSLLGYWTILWFEKKGWYFAGRNAILMLACIASSGFVYLGLLPYTPKIIGFLYIDTFLLSALIGAFLYIASQKLYQYMKNKNGGHAHFPFEKAVFPVVLLFAASVILTYYPL